MKTTRIVLAIASLVVTGGAFTWLGLNWPSIDAIDNIKFNQLVAEGIKLKVEHSKSAFSVSLVVIAALWGLVVAQKDEVQLIFQDWRELVMFITGSFLLLGSVMCFVLYQDLLAGVYESAGLAMSTLDPDGSKPPDIPNIFDPKIDFVRRAQVNCLFVGAAIGGFALVSAHKLRN